MLETVCLQKRNYVERIKKDDSKKRRISQMENIGINVDAVLRNCSGSYRETQAIKHQMGSPRLPKESYYISR